MPTLGLYVHLPFCIKKCRYCDFNSYPGLGGIIPTYVDALETEMKARAGEAAGRSVDTVFFGGGTPSVVGAGHLSRLLDAMGRCFPVESGAEITVEANPGTVDREGLTQLRRAGFNRLSFGVQALQPRLLQTLGRIHSREDSVSAVAEARRAGFDNLSLDLMFGLPGQTPDMWEATLKEAARLGPEHVSAYGLQLEEGTPLTLDVQAGRLSVPSEEETADMYWQAHDMLTAEGYLHYEISNFAQPGRECRHNLRYWRCLEYLGLGAGAHSYVAGRRTANAADPAEYIESVHRTGTAVAAGEEDGDVRRVFEFLMLGFRTSEGISEAEFRGRFGLGLREALHELDDVIAAGLAAWTGNRLHLTPSGWAVSNAVLSRILPFPDQ